MTARSCVISVLNHCLEWDKFVHLALIYSTPDGVLTYTNFIRCIVVSLWNVSDKDVELAAGDVVRKFTGDELIVNSM